MSKEPHHTEEKTPHPTAPLFALWRAAIDELERNAARWAEGRAGQLDELAQLDRTLRDQVIAASRGAVAAMERASAEAAAAASHLGAGFTRSAT
jgi:hypothetical protein